MYLLIFIFFFLHVFPVHTAAHPQPKGKRAIIEQFQATRALTTQDAAQRSKRNKQSLQEQFFYACHTCRPKKMQELIDSGADPLQKNPNGISALHLTAMRLNVNAKSRKSSMELLQSYMNCSLDDARNKGWTVLHTACAIGTISGTQAALELGASIDYLTPKQSSSLMLALWAEQRPTEILILVKLLFKFAVDQKKNITSARHVNGHTSLVIALRNLANMRDSYQRKLFTEAKWYDCKLQTARLVLNHTHDAGILHNALSFLTGTYAQQHIKFEDIQKLQETINIKLR